MTRARAWLALRAAQQPAPQARPTRAQLAALERERDTLRSALEASRGEMAAAGAMLKSARASLETAKAALALATDPATVHAHPDVCRHLELARVEHKRLEVVIAAGAARLSEARALLIGGLTQPIVNPAWSAKVRELVGRPEPK